MKDLYLLTNGFGDYYVIAHDSTKAGQALTKFFNDNDYGTNSQRQVTNVKLLAKGIKPYTTDQTKPFLSGDERLFIVED